MTRYYALAKNRFSKLPVLNQLLQKKKPLEPQKGYNVVEVYADVYKEEKVSIVNAGLFSGGDYYDYTNPPAVFHSPSSTFFMYARFIVRVILASLIEGQIFTTSPAVVHCITDFLFASLNDLTCSTLAT